MCKMKAICAYYKNTRRLGLVVEKLALTQDVSVYAFMGTLVRSPKSVLFLGDEIVALVFGRQGELPILLTNATEHSESNGTVVDVDPASADNIYMQALALCQRKFIVGKNPFTLTCSVKGCTLMVAPKDVDTLSYTMQGPAGNVVTESRDVQKDLLAQCSGFRSFQYSVTTDTCERDVAIKRGQLEILREIAHYTNRALVFSRLENERVTRELCITSTGCCEYQAVDKGDQVEYRVVKVPFTKVRVDVNSSLTAVECGLDMLLKAKTLSQALRGVSARAKD